MIIQNFYGALRELKSICFDSTCNTGFVSNCSCHHHVIYHGGKSKGTTCFVDTVPRKRKQIGFLLAPIVKEVSNIVSNLLVGFLLQILTLEFV